MLDTHTKQEIATELGIKPRTVDSHMLLIRRRLDIPNAAQLIEAARRENNIVPAPHINLMAQRHRDRDDRRDRDRRDRDQGKKELAG